MSIKLEGSHARALKWGIARTAYSPGGPSSEWVIQCACGKQETRGWPIDMPSDAMVKKFTQQGWRMSVKHQPVCNDCQKKERKVSKPVQVAGPDPKIARRIYAALDDHFDEAKRLYRAGWDDAKVAETLDVSLECVSRIRREAYGEIAEAPEIQGFRDELALLRMEMEDLQTRFATDANATMTKIMSIEARITPTPQRRAA